MKNAYWFKHDSNAKDDPKCVLLIEQLGLEGFGIYWVLIEILREQPDYHYPLALIPSIARRYNTSTQKVEAVIKGYGLFSTNSDEFFFSESLIERMKPFEYQSEKARMAANARWNKQSQCTSNASALPEQCKGNAIREDKIREDKSIKSAYGEFKNVLLTDEEYAKLKARFTDSQNRIERLSSYIESKGKRYKSHYATILTWARSDEPAKPTMEDKIPWK